MVRRIATMAVILIGSAGVVPHQSTASSKDVVTAMARVATDLKSCESAPSNMNTMAQNGCYQDTSTTPREDVHLRPGAAGSRLNSTDRLF